MPKPCAGARAEVPTSTSSTTAVFYKPAVAIARALGRFVEQPLIAGSITEVTRGFRLGSGELGRVQNGLVRSYALVLASGHRRPRRRLPRQPMTSWLTTILILLPMVGGARRLARCRCRATGSARSRRSSRSSRSASGSSRSSRFDFDDSSLQLDQQHSWFSALGVSYYVGQFGFSLWLVGLTVVCGAVACAYAWWAGRERPRAYFGLLLFLTGSVVGVFCAQDLLLFYAFFEAMLIPLYVLIGVWGGAGPARRDDQVRRLHGRRLAADAGGDHRLRRSSRGRST